MVGIFSGRVVAVVCALLVAAGGVLVALAPAHARGDGPPKTELREGQRTLQVGQRGSYCWSDADSGVCVDGYASYPAADRVEEDSELYVRLFKAQRPREFYLSAYRDVDGYGFPVGRPRPLPYTLKPVVRDGRTVAWDAVFKVKRQDRHYYLDAFGIWREGDASYAFHVKTKR